MNSFWSIQAAFIGLILASSQVLASSPFVETVEIPSDTQIEELSSAVQSVRKSRALITELSPCMDSLRIGAWCETPESFAEVIEFRVQIWANSLRGGLTIGNAGNRWITFLLDPKKFAHRVVEGIPTLPFFSWIWTAEMSANRNYAQKMVTPVMFQSEKYEAVFSEIVRCDQFDHPTPGCETASGRRETTELVRRTHLRLVPNSR